MPWKTFAKLGKGAKAAKGTAGTAKAAKAATGAKAALKTAGAAGAKALPGLGGAAGKVAGVSGAGAKVAGGALLGAGAAAGAGAVRSFKNAGFVLFLFSTIIFVLSQIFGFSKLYAYASCFFMIYSAITIFGYKGLVIAIIFTIYYFVLGSPNITSIKYTILPIFIIAVLIRVLISKISNDGTLVEDVKKELAIGALLILIFFIDVGMIDWLKDEFGFVLPIWVGLFLTLIPLWAYVGLFSMVNEEGEKTWLTTLLVIIGILYLIGILIFVSTEAQAATEEILPGPEELLAAKEDARGKQIVYWYYCFKTGQYMEMNECMTKKAEEDRLGQICQKQENYLPGTDDFDKCVEEERKKAKDIVVTGIKDPTIDKPTKIEFIKQADFPTPYYVAAGSGDKVNYPIEVKITNPRRLLLEIVPSCHFNKTNGNVAGKILGFDRGEYIYVVPEESLDFVPPTNAQMISQSGEEAYTTIVCQPEAELNGAYRLVYQAEIKNMQTISRLQRVFIGEDKSSDWKRENVPELKRTFFPGQTNRPQAPADFAKLNFEFGLPTTNPIIDRNDGIVLSSTIENAGQGRITAIHSYRIDMPGFSVKPSDSSCFEGYNTPIPKTKRMVRHVYSKTCIIDSIPPELASPESIENREFAYKEFEGTLNYDYLVHKEIPVTVEVLIS